LKGIGFKTLRDIGGVDVVAKRVITEGADFIDLVSKGASRGCRVDDVLALGESAAKLLDRDGINLVRFGQAYFPVQFAELEPPVRPLWFFCRGNQDLLASEAVAAVGTRSPSKEGEFLTRYAVASVQEAGATVVSGLAKGIDEIAHEWALLCKVPNISVLGTGILRSYPAKNAELASRIVDACGLLISEYMPDATPTAESFVWRNRLQAALAKCVVAPEWKRSSGTAHLFGLPSGFAPKHQSDFKWRRAFSRPWCC
jgi:DNA protecting protein DprA